MARLGDTVAALRRSQRGYTLVELLVAATIGMVVLGGAVTVFVGAVRSEPRTASKVSGIQQGRFAVERIVRELRQGTEVPTAESSHLELVTYLPEGSCGTAEGEAEACLVTYDCATAECTRTVAQPDGSSPGSTVRIVDGLASTEAFSYSPEGAEAEPTYVEVELSFASREGGPVVIADGVALRNEGS